MTTDKDTDIRYVHDTQQPELVDDRNPAYGHDAPEDAIDRAGWKVWRFLVAFGYSRAALWVLPHLMLAGHHPHPMWLLGVIGPLVAGSLVQFTITGRRPLAVLLLALQVIAVWLVVFDGAIATPLLLLVIAAAGLVLGSKFSGDALVAVFVAALTGVIWWFGFVLGYQNNQSWASHNLLKVGGLWTLAIFSVTYMVCFAGALYRILTRRGLLGAIVLTVLGGFGSWFWGGYQTWFHDHGG